MQNSKERKVYVFPYNKKIKKNQNAILKKVYIALLSLFYALLLEFQNQM